MADFEARVKAVLDDSELKKLDELENKEITIKTNLGNTSKDVENVNQKIKAAQRSATSFGSTLKSALNFGGAFSITSKAIQAIEKAMRSAIEATKNWDSSIKDLRMATGGSYEDTNQLVKEYNQLGKELGATTSEVSNGADTWIRQGHNIADTNILIRNSTILSKVANLESATATEHLTSAMKGYGIAAQDTIDIVDKLTSVDLVSATDAGGLAEAMSKTAVSANKVGVSMDELLGYLAVVGETTQDNMSSIGNAFKTIFARYTDIKGGKLELIDEDGTTEKLSNVEQSLANVGIDMRSTITEFDDFGDTLVNLNAKWDTLNGLQQNAIANALGGTRHKDRFLILMENYDAAASYMETAMNSSGVAEAKFDAYLDSIEAKTKSLQAAFESLSTNTISTETYGGIIEASTSLVTFLDKTNLLKGTLSGFVGAGTIKIFTTLATGIANAAVQMNNFNTALNLVKAGNVGEGQMEQLVQLTANLSKSQTKAIISSQALSNQQRIAILQAQGLSTAEAQAAIATMGLSSAENVATASTFSLSGAIKGLWATLMANPLVLVGAAIAGMVTAFSNLSQAAEESTQKADDNFAKLKESAQSAIETKKSVRALIDQYKALADAQSGSWTSEQASELLSIQEQLSDLVGSQAANIDLVNGSLEQEYEKLLNIYSLLSDEELQATESAYLAAQQKLEKGYERDSNFWGNSTENDFLSSWYIRRAYEELNNVTADAAQEWWGIQAGFKDTQWLGDIPRTLEAIGSYEEGLEKLYEWRELLNSAEGLDFFGDDLGNAYDTSDALSYLNSKIEDYNEIITEAKTAKDSFFAAKANDEALDYLVGNNIATQEDFNNWIDSVLSNEIYSKDYAQALISAMQGYLSNFEIPDNIQKSFISDIDKLVSDISDHISNADEDVLDEWLEGMNPSEYQSFFDWWKSNSNSEVVTSSVDTMMTAFANHMERVSIAANGLSREIGNITSGAEEELENVNSLITGINAAQEALLSQSTGKSISLEDFNSDELKDYTDALEYSNGVLQLNSDKVNDIIAAKTLEQIAVNGANKALAQTKYLENAADIAKLRSELSGLSENENEARNAVQEKIDTLLTENSMLKEICASYDLMSASLQEAAGEYQVWINSQSAFQSGDMFDSAVDAIAHINNTLNNAESELFGRVGRSDYEAAVDFIVPDSVDRSDKQAVNSYLDSISDLLIPGSNGTYAGLNIAKFCEAAVDAGLMVLDEAGSAYEIVGGKTMADFANGLGLSLPLVQAMFGELEEFGAEFDWADEANRTMGDLAVSATEAAEVLRSFDGNESYQMSFDVSDIEDGQEKINSLNKTISDMQDLKTKPNIDSSEVEAANEIIRAAVAQKQYLTQPDVMRVDTSVVEGEIGSALSTLQRFVSLSKKIEVGQELGYDTSSAQAELDQVASKIQQLDPNIAMALEIDTSSLDTINQSIAGLTCDVIANLLPNDSAIIGYTPSDLTALVTYNVDSSEVDGYQPPNKTATITYNIVTKGSPPSSRGIGGASVHGTAQASGTAYASGNWGTATGGKTLVGELGRELYVDLNTGRWQTVGDNGAEFVDIPQNAIVFNHKQTESLFKNGYISSRGKTLASGNAMVTGSIPLDILERYALASGSSNTSSSASGSGGDSASENTDPKDWIEVLISKIERAIKRITTIAESAYKTLSSKTTAVLDEISAVTGEISIQEQAYNRYLQEANSVGLSSELQELVKNGTIDITQYDEDTQKKIDDFEKWYTKALDASDAAQQLHEDLAKIYEDNFNNIKEDYENQFTLLEHQLSLYNNSLDALTESGYFETANYYAEIQEIEYQKVAVLNEQLTALEAALTDAMNSGEIEKYSDAWYEMQSDINDTKEALQEANLSLIEYAATMRELEWEYFDFAQSRIEQLTKESDFLISLFENSDLFNDKGKLTDSGMATIGLHGMNYNVLMSQSNQYAKELLKINKDLANDPSNTKLIERREELLDLQHDSILAAEDEKQAIIELIEEGIEAELDSLQKLIDKYTDALDSAKDLYDYQKKIRDHTSEISSLQKQLMAYENDESEETRATIQKLKVSMEEAKEDLEETEYDQYIDDQKKLLDELYVEYEEILNQRIDDLEASFDEVIGTINDNSSAINETITSAAADVGYILTDEMQTIWSASSESIESVVSTYGDGFNEKLTSVNKVLAEINHYVSQMVANSDVRAVGETVAFASGGLADFTGLAQLDGTPKKPELVLNAKDTQNFLELKDVLRELSSRELRIGDSSDFNVGNVSHAAGFIDLSSVLASIRNQPAGTTSNSFGDINITIPIDHVDGYNDFVNQLRDDRKFERMIQDMTVGRLSNGSRLAKNKYEW